MKITGIICEYNPLHLGHRKQLRAVRQQQGEGSGIVCLMSGNFVQRGAPAIFDKSLRAEAALKSGADLVLELPVTAALDSAEGFAAKGVDILSPFCDALCFGAETADIGKITDCARALLSDGFRNLLRAELDKGLSFPAARQAALEHMGTDGSILSTPNNILAVEYCKAILSRNSAMAPLPIYREGSYHEEKADADNPSATAVRSLIEAGQDWLNYVPAEAADCFANAAVHTMRAGEGAILSRLRTMTDAEFEALPFGSEGLWRKFMHACREEATLNDILAATKSKRYTYTRIARMAMCAFLGIDSEMMASPVPYVRVLGFNDRGREILRKAKRTGVFLNAGECSDSAYQQTENRVGDLYGLCCESGPEKPGSEARRRVVYLK